MAVIAYKYLIGRLQPNSMFTVANQLCKHGITNHTKHHF
jgi:hypothetical protein